MVTISGNSWESCLYGVCCERCSCFSGNRDLPINTGVSQVGEALLLLQESFGLGVSVFTGELPAVVPGVLIRDEAQKLCL